MRLLASQKNEIPQGLAIGTNVNCALIYHALTQLIVISLPLWRVIQLPAVIQIITFTLMHSSSLTVFSAFLSLSLALLSPPVVIEDGQLSALRHVPRGKQGEVYIAP